jgi:hypothetical protein
MPTHESQQRSKPAKTPHCPNGAKRPPSYQVKRLQPRCKHQITEGVEVGSRRAVPTANLHGIGCSLSAIVMYMVGVRAAVTAANAYELRLVYHPSRLPTQMNLSASPTASSTAHFAAAMPLLTCARDCGEATHLGSARLNAMELLSRKACIDRSCRACRVELGCKDLHHGAFASLANPLLSAKYSQEQSIRVDKKRTSPSLSLRKHRSAAADLRKMPR